ncbi:MAG: glycosyltransferase family 4 protein [Coriobacteriia bacterium]|nr:glycosyltransferase family 4 protein [Coriobacteriia bacterium]
MNNPIPRFPLLRGFRVPRQLGFNLVGYVTANLGLGVAARNTLARLVEANEPLRVISIDPGSGHVGKDATHEHMVARTTHVPYSVNLFHINPPEVIGHAGKWRNQLDLRSSINVCVPFWELPHLPPLWSRILGCMDYVLAPTRFIEQACLEELPRERVLYYPQTIEVPRQVSGNRDHWSIPNDVVAFLVTLDINSDVERKNPWAAIEAFAMAFPERSDVRLVVRLNGIPTTPITIAQVTALRSRAASDHRVRLIEGSLSYQQILSLYASCDVLLSLHRSEGLGLPLMEAMSLGKPVVATAWSGNMDFMDKYSACLVPFDLVPVEATQPAYAADVIGPEQVWAQPRVAAAADHMIHLADDNEFRRQIGEQAKVRIAEHQEMARKESPLGQLIAVSALPSHISASSRARAKQFERLIGPPLVRVVTNSVKHAIVVALRALRLYPPAPEHERTRQSRPEGENDQAPTQE